MRSAWIFCVRRFRYLLIKSVGKRCRGSRVSSAGWNPFYFTTYLINYWVSTWCIMQPFMYSCARVVLLFVAFFASLTEFRCFRVSCRGRVTCVVSSGLPVTCSRVCDSKKQWMEPGLSRVVSIYGLTSNHRTRRYRIFLNGYCKSLYAEIFEWFRCME